MHNETITEQVAETIRYNDLPKYKDSIMAVLFGQFLEFLKGNGLQSGREFDVQTREIFQCSQRIIWIDRYNDNLQITVVLNSLHMSMEFGLVEKKNGTVTKNVLYRNKLENLRYKISIGTPLELTGGSQEKFDLFFEDFKSNFEKLKPKQNETENSSATPQ